MLNMYRKNYLDEFLSGILPFASKLESCNNFRVCLRCKGYHGRYANEIKNMKSINCGSKSILYSCIVVIQSGAQSNSFCS